VRPGFAPGLHHGFHRTAFAPGFHHGFHRVAFHRFHRFHGRRFVSGFGFLPFAYADDDCGFVWRRRYIGYGRFVLRRVYVCY
jgi:hypothetical protein